MIMYERKEDFVMVRQYDHSLLSGHICSHWKKDWFLGFDRWSDVMTAIGEHDRSWIDLDETPILNDAKKTPYSFIDLPLKLKIPFYSKGVDEVEELSSYSALLCSMHFASFFKDATSAWGKSFFAKELMRQQKLKDKLCISSDVHMEVLKFHFDLLQFGDDISLYICLQEPCVSKEEEIDWYREGFPQLFPFIEKKIDAFWVDREKIILNPFPFEDAFDVSIGIKEVKKADVEQYGLAIAYENTPWTTRKVSLVER